MGLEKQITLQSGIDVNYHRVVSLNVITNSENTIEVASYTSQAKRREEKEALEEARETGQYPETNVFIETAYYTAPYDQSMTIDGAYEWLKQNGFEGAEDVMEDD